ncbi:putative TetR family transcriptional regulator [Actinacidiphila reveromycinica]|uniref:Putative TetR family transcriptional regulator n=1 Tax=Actinacidiphila reveromycinica TaxID=659352 RepID=A0A7U3VQY8_9ACTN|nr:TetR/AcrR family transcriptional regulator [Streptomyces sp. SN-593]BBB00296.1 putative TetR family transcriptional regulator [Streptomyces sp. SN-593]
MPDRPYHHGHLRAALLAAAERTLRESGAEQISLRDLARQVGVSHAAPSRHFRDRQALLDALAEVGFARLGAEIAAAVDASGRTGARGAAGAGEAGAEEDGAEEAGAEEGGTVGRAGFEAQLRAVATGYVRFAVEDAALLELMMAVRKDEGADAKTPERPYVLLDELIRRGHASGCLAPGDPGRLVLIVLATFQGIAALVTSRRVPLDRIDALVADAAALFVRHDD